MHLHSFLCYGGTKGDSLKLKTLLNYMENTRKENTMDEELQQIQDIVDEVIGERGIRTIYF